MPKIQNMFSIGVLGTFLTLCPAALAGYIYDCQDVLNGPGFPLHNDDFNRSYTPPPVPGSVPATPAGGGTLSSSSGSMAGVSSQPTRSGGGTPNAQGIMGHVAGSNWAGPSLGLPSYYKSTDELLQSAGKTASEPAPKHEVVDLSMEEVADLLSRSGVALPAGNLEMSDRGRAEARGFARIFREQENSIYGRRAKFQITHDSGHNSWILATVSALLPAGSDRPRTLIEIFIDDRSELQDPDDSYPLWGDDIPAHHFTAIKGVAPGVSDVKARDLQNFIVRDRDSFHVNIANAPALLGKRMFVSGTLASGDEQAMSAVLVGVWFDGKGYRLMFAEAGDLYEFVEFKLDVAGPEFDLR